MKRVLALALSAMLTTSLFADPQSSATATTSSGSAQATAKTRRKRSATSTTDEKLKAISDALASQQEQIQTLQQDIQRRDQVIEQLQQQLQQTQSAASQAQSQAQAAQSAADQQKDSVSKLQSDVGDMKTNATSAANTTQEEQKRVSALEEAIGRVRFTGDVRLRQEDFFQSWSGCKPGACNPRMRERIRLRMGFEGRLNEDFVGGIFLASGAITDPTSTNETLTNVFEKKSIGFDRGYITFNPVAHNWLSLTGGKFAYTWQRTSVTFDPDLNPEGFSEKFSFNTENPVFTNVTLTGMQLLFNESKSGTDSYALGGQFLTKIKLGKRVTITPSFTGLNWNTADVILNEPAFLSNGVPVSGNGFCTVNGLVCAPTLGVFAPNGETNATFTDAAGNLHYKSGFLYADVIVPTVVQTPWKRLPWNLSLEYEDNLRAASNNSHSYAVDTGFGQQKEKGDVQFGYEFRRVEQDAVISSFAESDQRTPTNLLQHRIYFLYRVRKNTTLSFTDWIGRTLDSTLQHAILTNGIKPGMHEPYLNRLQFDVIYTF